MSKIHTITSSLSQSMLLPSWMGRLATAAQLSSNNLCSGGSTGTSHVCMWKITCAGYHPCMKSPALSWYLLNTIMKLYRDALLTSWRKPL